MLKQPASAFRELEKSGWESAVADYDGAFTRLTTQAIAPLLDALQVKAATRVLDVACGPGQVSAQAAQRGAQVLGIDFSRAMVTLAQQRHPRLQFQEGDAEALALPDTAFDAVAMNFGLLHLDRPEQALAEAARVLAPGGRCGFTVWAPPPQTEGFRIVLDAIEQHGRIDVPLPPGPPFFRYSDATVASEALRAAGLVEPSVVVVPQLWRFTRPEQLFDAMLHGTVRTAALLRAQTPQALPRIRAAISAGAAAFTGSEGIDIPMPSVLAVARKPG